MSNSTVTTKITNNGIVFSPGDSIEVDPKTFVIFEISNETGASKTLQIKHPKLEPGNNIRFLIDQEHTWTLQADENKDDDPVRSTLSLSGASNGKGIALEFTDDETHDEETKIGETFELENGHDSHSMSITISHEFSESIGSETRTIGVRAPSAGHRKNLYFTDGDDPDFTIISKKEKGG